MNQQRQNIWVLGGTGFIGTSLVKQLASNPTNMLNLLLHKDHSIHSLENYNTFRGSLENFDFSWMERYPPDIVFHLARLGGSNTITRYISSHVGARANKKLISCLSQLPSPPNIVYVSGSLMYGNQTNESFVTEKSALLPTSYAKHYIRGERPLLEVQAKRQLDIRFARPGWIIGPSSWFKVFYWNYYLKTGKVPMFGNGQQLMSLVHVEDCAGMIINLANQGKAFQNANIYSGMPISQMSFAETLARLLNASIEPISISSLKYKFGKTVSEAFESSIPLSTDYPILMEQYQPIYPTVEKMLMQTISFLKHY